MDRYAQWISEHEPDAAALEKQRRTAKNFPTRAKVSLLTPVHNTAAKFLEEMFASVEAQTYDNWELCVVDGGSDSAETIETLKRWEARDNRESALSVWPKISGSAENTNRALQTGDRRSGRLPRS